VCVVVVVAGNWITSDEFPVETDEAGNANNVLHVTAETASGAATAGTGTTNSVTGTTISETVISAQRTPSPTPCAGARKDGGGKLLQAALTPFRFGLQVVFAPFRFILRLVGLL
jgi:hypothetical protein